MPVPYRVGFAPSVKADMRRLRRDVQERALARIEVLGEEPRPAGSLRLRNRDGIYRIRVGDYRVVYAIYDERLEVHVLRVRHRSIVYRNL